MEQRRLPLWLGFGLVVALVGGSIAEANHSYLLSAQELMSGLQKASSPQEKGFFLIDVRTLEEHVRGVIPGTDMNIDYQEMTQRHHEIGAQRGDHIVVYCQSGRRSNIAAETLADLGYRHVYNVEGSMNAWIEAGFPVKPPRR